MNVNHFPEALPADLKRKHLAEVLLTITRARYEQARAVTRDPRDIVLILCAVTEPWGNTILLRCGISPAEVDAASASLRAIGAPPTYPVAVTRESVRDQLAELPEGYIDVQVREALAFPRVDRVPVLVIAFGGVSILETSIEPPA